MVSTLLVVVVVVPSSSKSKSFSPLAILSGFFVSFPLFFPSFLFFFLWITAFFWSQKSRKEEIKDKVFKYSICFPQSQSKYIAGEDAYYQMLSSHIQVPLGQYFKEFIISYQMCSTELHSICSEEISQWPTFTCRLILTKPILLRSDCQPP